MLRSRAELAFLASLVLTSGRRARAGKAGEALYIDRKHGFHIAKKKIDKVPRYIVSPNASSIKIWACLEPQELRYREDGADKTVRLTPSIKIERIIGLRLPEKLPKPTELGLKDIAQAVEGYIELGEYLESEDFKKLLPEGVEYRAERGRIPIIIRYYRTRRRWKLKTGYDPEFQEPPEHEGEYERCYVEIGDAELARELSRILSDGDKLRRLLRRYVHVAIIAMFMLRSQKGWWRILEYLPEKAVREFMGMYSLDKKRGKRYWSREARKIFYVRKVQYLASFVRYFVMEHRRSLSLLDKLVDAATTLRRRRIDPRKGVSDLLREIKWIEERVKDENRDYRLAEAHGKMRDIIESYGIYVDDIEKDYKKYLGEFDPIDYLKMFKPFNMLPLEEYVKDTMKEMKNPYWYIYRYRGERRRWAGSKIPDVSRARTLIYRRIWRYFSKRDNDKYIDMLVDAIVKHEIEFIRERELRTIKRENMRRYRIGAVVTKWDELQLEKRLKRMEKELREKIRDTLRIRMKPSRMRARAWIKYLYALTSKIITHAFHPYIYRYMYTPGKTKYDEEGNVIHVTPRKKWFFHVLGVDQYNIDMRTTEAFWEFIEKGVAGYAAVRDGLFRYRYPTLKRFGECIEERTVKECLEEVNWEIRDIVPGGIDSPEEVQEVWRMVRMMHIQDPAFYTDPIMAQVFITRYMDKIQKMIEPPGIITRHVPEPLWIDPSDPDYKENFRKRFLSYIPLLAEERKAAGMPIGQTSYANLGRFFEKYGRPPRDIPVRVFIVNPDFDWQKIFEVSALLTMKIVEKAVEKGDLKLPDKETIREAMRRGVEAQIPFDEGMLLGEIGRFLDELDRYPPSEKPLLRNLYAYVIGKAAEQYLDYRMKDRMQGKDNRARFRTIYEPLRKQAVREGYQMLEFDPRIGSKMSRRFRNFMFLETKIDALLGVAPSYFLLQHRNIYWDNLTRRARERLAYLAIKTRGAILGNYDFIGERREYLRISLDEWEKTIDERIKRRIDAKIYATAREFVKALHSKFIRLMQMPHRKLMNLLKKYGDKSLIEIWLRRELELELVRKGQPLEFNEVLEKIRNKEKLDQRSIEILKKVHREILRDIKDSDERRKLRRELTRIEKAMERKSRMEMERKIDELVERIIRGHMNEEMEEPNTKHPRHSYETKADMLAEKQREAEERENRREKEERRKSSKK
jgi:hypothetical protein